MRQKMELLNGRIYNMLGMINLNRINIWEYMKGKSLLVYISFNGTDLINNTEHINFSFKTYSLNDLLDFNIYLIDDNDAAIVFNAAEKKKKKNSILNFKTEVFRDEQKIKTDKIYTTTKRWTDGFHARGNPKGNWKL